MNQFELINTNKENERNIIAKYIMKKIKEYIQNNIPNNIVEIILVQLMCLKPIQLICSIQQNVLIFISKNLY